jgi:hypothetical protein
MPMAFLGWEAEVVVLAASELVLEAFGRVIVLELVREALHKVRAELDGFMEVDLQQVEYQSLVAITARFLCCSMAAMSIALSGQRTMVVSAEAQGALEISMATDIKCLAETVKRCPASSMLVKVKVYMAWVVAIKTPDETQAMLRSPMKMEFEKVRFQSWANTTEPFPGYSKVVTLVAFLGWGKELVVVALAEQVTEAPVIVEQK